MTNLNNSLGNVIEWQMSFQIRENSFLSPGQNKSGIKNTDMTVISTNQFLLGNANRLKDCCMVSKKIMLPR